ncbi:3D domain-containing protein [Candidatus Uhrbacteria bacterium]|jgi:3D (Asp-Asp-Asp) domain-containing protein|nr:3D domain-containing protein [Candidatus Uhrbacteria bacterium]
MLNKAITQLKSKWEEDAFYVRTVPSFCYQKWVNIERAAIPIRRYALDLSVLSFVLVIALYIFTPTTANADPIQDRTQFDHETVQLIVVSMQNGSRKHGSLPVSDNAPARRHYTIPMTAYTSEVAQTDDTPCITASGLDVCERNIENVVAANFLPLGTRVKIPELFGDRVFYVEDRMNRRYDLKMDIWLKDYDEAIQFGLQYTTIEVF